MTSPTPIIIGQYCSDFLVEQPLSGDNYYYYAAKDGGNLYYIATSRVTHGSGTVANQVDSAESNTIRIIPSPFVIPTGGQVTDTGGAGSEDNNFREFRFKLIWNPSITPDFTATKIIPIDKRRYLTWKDASGGTTGDAYSSSKKDRFVELTNVNNLIEGVKFSGQTTADTAIIHNTTAGSGSLVLSTTLSSFTKTTVEGLNFFATTNSPVIQQRATQLKYLILKEDFDTFKTTTATASKQLRYLRYNGSKFQLVDLYDPDVKTTTIQECAFRFSKQTTVALTASDINSNTNTPPATVTATPPAKTGGSATTQSKATTWGLDSYFKSGATVGLNTNGSTGEPGSYTTKTSYKSMFTLDTVNAGFDISNLENMTGTAYSDDSVLTNAMNNDGFQEIVLAIPSGRITYDDLAEAGFGASPTPKTNTVVLKFVITNFIVDKTVEELFTDMHVTLLKVQHQASSPAYARDATVIHPNNTNNFLGLEQALPANTPTTETITASAVDAGGSSKTDLIVRDYFKFYNPARATQFKFYDLGKGNEYLWQAKWPSGFSDTYTYITASADNNKVQFAPSSTITQDTRGWIMEYDTGLTPPGVKLRWAGSSTPKYIALTGTTTSPADNAPVRVATTLVSTSAAAATFNCIQCSSVDSSGACIPYSPSASAYTGNQSPPGGGRRSPIVLSSGVSPVSTSSFRMRLSSASGSTFQYSLTQIAGGAVVGSPGSGVFTASAAASPVVISATVPSPIPDGIVVDFVLTRQGVLSSDSAKRNAVFIKSANGNQYLKYNTAGGVNRVELITSNRPSDDDGFAWMIIKSATSPGTGSSTRYNLYSLYTSGSPGATRANDRYIQNNGFTLGTTTSVAHIVFDGVDISTLTPNVVNNSLA